MTVVESNVERTLTEAVKFLNDYHKENPPPKDLYSVGQSLRTTYKAVLFRYEKTNTRTETIWIFPDKSEITISQFGSYHSKTLSVRL